MNFDLIGIGCAAVDDLLYVDAFPSPDAKTIVTQEERQCGGLTAIALIAAARFGARCAYAGALGIDAASEFIAGELMAEGVDLTLAPRRPDARPIHSRIVVDTAHHTRNIFYAPGKEIGAVPSPALDDAIRRAKALFVDHYGGETTVNAARVARQSGVPVIADVERSDAPRFREILAAVDHLIVSERFALSITGAAHAGEAVLSLLDGDRQVVVVTCGERGCRFAERGDTEARGLPAFAVAPVDTTGCGDVFHGIYAAGVAMGIELSERIRLASAGAAIKARLNGAQRGIPVRAAIEAFLAQRATS